MPGIMSGSYARDQADAYLQQVQAFGIDSDQDTIDFIAPPTDTTMGSLGYTPYAGTIHKGASRRLTESEARSTFAANIQAAKMAAYAGSYPRAVQLLQVATDALHLNGFQLRGIDRIAVNQVKALFPPKLQAETSMSGMGDFGNLDLGIPGLGGGTGSFINVLLLGAGIGLGLVLVNRYRG